MEKITFYKWEIENLQDRLKAIIKTMRNYYNSDIKHYLEYLESVNEYMDILKERATKND